MFRFLLFCILVSFTFSSCKNLPAIPLTTPQPLEVNLNMRLDVYQYRGDEPGDKEASRSLTEASQRMRNRMEEIQTLKNNRIIGEDHRGLLQIRETPAGDWGTYVKRTVEEENTDRMLIMRNEAKESNRAIHEVQAEQARIRIEQAFKGEWIEVPGEKPGSFKWAQAVRSKASSAPSENPPQQVQPDS